MADPDPTSEKIIDAMIKRTNAELRAVDRVRRALRENGAAGLK